MLHNITLHYITIQTPLLAINSHKIQGNDTNSEGSGLDQNTLLGIK